MYFKFSLKLISCYFMFGFRLLIMALALFVLPQIVYSQAMPAVCDLTLSDNSKKCQESDFPGATPQAQCDALCNTLKAPLTVICVSAAPAATSCPNESSAKVKPVELQDPLGIGQKDDALNIIIIRVISKVLGVIGALALAAFVYGGVMWLISGGNEEKVKTGMHAMMYAAIGILVIFAAYAILSTVLKGLGVS